MGCSLLENTLTKICNFFKKTLEGNCQQQRVVATKIPEREFVLEEREFFLCVGICVFERML